MADVDEALVEEVADVLRATAPDSTLPEELQRDAHAVLAYLAATGRLRQPAECTCYPGGWTHDTFEGPQPWCDEHGLPSAAYEWGLREGASTAADRG